MEQFAAQRSISDVIRARVFSFLVSFALHSTCCQWWSYLYLSPAWPSFCRTKQNDRMDGGGKMVFAKKAKTIRKWINVLLLPGIEREENGSKKEKQRKGTGEGGCWNSPQHIQLLVLYSMCFFVVGLWIAIYSSTKEIATDNRMGVVALSSLILFGIISFMPFLVRLFFASCFGALHASNSKLLYVDTYYVVGTPRIHHQPAPGAEARSVAKKPASTPTHTRRIYDRIIPTRR